MLTASQISAAQSIVNIFETGEVLGDYGNVSVTSGDTGHLSFGRSQTTLGSGNLPMLLERYCSNGSARFGPRLAPYLARLAARDITLDQDFALHNLLRATADDPVMRDLQDGFFDEFHWEPATRAAARESIVSALGVVVVYDSRVQGSWKPLRDRTVAQLGGVALAGERAWISAYVDNRRSWLARHRRADLRRTAYRMEAFQRLIEQGYWSLELPLVVFGREISVASLAALPVRSYDGPQPGTRALALQSPLLRGLDVRLVQLGLSEAGMDIRADGVFGQTSTRVVAEFQQQAGLAPTGIADEALIARLVG